MSGHAEHVVVCGGGVVGLAIAWQAAQRGLAVTVVDPNPGTGASHAAAGLLAPVFEAHPGEEALLQLNLASYARWPAFAAELLATTSIDVLFRPEGTLAVAFDDDDLRALEDLRRFQESLGLPVARLRARGCRELEPLLTPRLRGGVQVDTEASVDPRRVCHALAEALALTGVEHVRDRVSEVIVEADRVRGVRTDGGGVVHASHVVIALGAWSGATPGVPPSATPPVRPVKGQIIRLRFDPADPPLHRNVHALARGSEIYLLPRASGELVIGATVEEKGFDTTVTAGGVHELLDAAIDVLPVVAELEHIESIARLRPGSADNAPVLGPTGIEGLVLATGHHRNGVLLTPVTADAVAALLAEGKLPTEAEAFTLERFA